MFLIQPCASVTLQESHPVHQMNGTRSRTAWKSVPRRSRGSALSPEGSGHSGRCLCLLGNSSFAVFFLLLSQSLAWRSSLHAWALCFTSWVAVSSCHLLILFPAAASTLLHPRALKTTPTLPPSHPGLCSEPQLPGLCWSTELWLVAMALQGVIEPAHRRWHSVKCPPPPRPQGTDGLFHGMGLFLHLSWTPSSGWHCVVSHNPLP